MTDKEKLIVSYHEVGHALVAAHCRAIPLGYEDHHYPAYVRASAIRCRWMKMSTT